MQNTYYNNYLFFLLMSISEKYRELKYYQHITRHLILSNNIKNNMPALNNI